MMDQNYSEPMCLLSAMKFHHIMPFLQVEEYRYICLLLAQLITFTDSNSKEQHYFIFKWDGDK